MSREDRGDGRTKEIEVDGWEGEGGVAGQDCSQHAGVPHELAFAFIAIIQLGEP